MSTLPQDLFEDEILANLPGASAYDKWKASNSGPNGDYTNWAKYRDKVLAYKKGDQRPAEPAMATKNGKILVASAKLHMSVTDIGSAIPPVLPTNYPPFRGPQVITQGGTYFDSWESNSSTPCISIATTQPVILKGRVRNLSSDGYMIDAYHFTGAGVDVTVEDMQVFGGPTYQQSSRWFVAKDWVKVLIQRCTIEGTRGIELWPNSLLNSTCKITKCRHHNILGGATEAGLSHVGNFVQFREVLNTAIEVSWCEIENQYNLSEPEDIISIYHTNNVHMFDCMLWHHSQPGNAQPGSFGGISIDGSDAAAVGCSNNIIERNQVVDGMGIVAFVQNAGSNNQLLNNRVIADQFIPGGALKRSGFSGLDITPGPGSGNHAHGNVVGYMGVDANNWPGPGGFRSDGNLVGADEGDAAEWANNTHYSGTINAAAEAAEWASWLQKKINNGIVVGAPA
jgi:hypothetical protein